LRESAARDGGTHAATRASSRRAAIATLAVGGLALALALTLTLSRASVRRTGTNDVTLAGVVETLRGAHRLCQDGELLPAGTAAVELTGVGRRRPELSVEALDAATGAPLATGASDAWRDDSRLTVRLHPAVGRERAVRVCVALRAPRAGTSAALYGEPAAGARSATDAGQRLGGRIRLDYVRGAPSSWASFAPTVLARLGRAHALSGSAVALLAGLLMLLTTALAAWLLVRTS